MPGVDFVRGIATMLRKDADYQLFRMSGAEHSMLVSMDRSYLQKTFKQIVEGKGDHFVINQDNVKQYLPKQ